VSSEFYFVAVLEIILPLGEVARSAEGGSAKIAYSAMNPPHRNAVPPSIGGEFEKDNLLDFL